MTEKEFLALGAPGTKLALMLLVARQALRVEGDVVGNLKRSASALEHLLKALRSLVQSYWEAANLSAQGIAYVLGEIEPGDKVDRLGVALYVVPQAGTRITKGMLKEIGDEIECAKLTLRRLSYELCPDGDLFIDEPGLVCRRPEWLTDGDVVNSAIVPLVRLSRRHEIYLQLAGRAARALEMANVPETPAKVQRTITVSGVIDSVCWSTRECVVHASDEADAAPSSLAGAQRVFIFTVESDKLVGELFGLARARIRQQFVLDVSEKMVDGGEVKQEFWLHVAD
jgi:hypothetical protein